MVYLVYEIEAIFPAGNEFFGGIPQAVRGHVIVPLHRQEFQPLDPFHSSEISGNYCDVDITCM